jgi:hypothetical protein
VLLPICSTLSFKLSSMYPSPDASFTSVSDQEVVYHNSPSPASFSPDGTTISWSTLELSTPSPAMHYSGPQSSLSPPTVPDSSAFASYDQDWSTAGHLSSPMSIHSAQAYERSSSLSQMHSFSYGSASPASQLSTDSISLPCMWPLDS